MNRELRDLARLHQLDDRHHFLLRVVFALDCVEWTRHLIENKQMLEALSAGHQFVSGEMDLLALNRVAERTKSLALNHPARQELDGAHHATLSASFGIARALAGDAWNAAEYAAFALVYAQPKADVTDPAAFAHLHKWQAGQLETRLLEFGVLEN